MGCRLLIVSLLFASCFQEMLAARHLEGEDWMEKNLVIQSLRTEVTPSGPSCETHIPVGRCTLSEMNVAGQVAHSTPPSPEVAANFAVASIDKETQKQDSSF
ncbi:hypothetical protein P3X46_008357 [Hevea brasiliensis]|uniref:Uncharacterized protein n=1 Tax=Hevea brasiliensis TaxID=3981 RepID=A0ABQ9MLU8_HEVBR|nr:hypothetical protein P3X46_008357 [Hevea brasiliensis]